MEYYDPQTTLQGDQMALNTQWTVWIHNNTNPDWDIGSYEHIYQINNIGSMWRFISVFGNLDKGTRQYYIMRDGITPIWEDNNNKHGAICSIMIDNSFRTNRATHGDMGVDVFSAICILVMNESFVRNNLDVNGLCYSAKGRNILIKLWVKNYEVNKNFIEKLPLSILKCIDNMLASSGERKQAGRSKVSVQVKQIKPMY